MVASLNYDLRGIDVAAHAFRDLAAAGKDTEPLADKIGGAMVTSVGMRFEAEQAPDGTPWKKTRRGGKILQDQGNLSDSITHAATKDSVAVGTNLIYAGTHQFGAVIKPKNAKMLAFKIGGGMVFAKQVTIPARPFLGVNADDQDEMAANAAEYFQDAMGAR